VEEDRRNVIVFSLRRSLTHAIISWICRQSGSARHYNNCTIKGVLGNAIRPSKEGTAKINYGEKPYKFHLYNFEDTLVNYKANIYLDLDNVTYILIIRDPFNLVASRFKIGWGMKIRGNAKDTILDVWKQHALEYLNSDKIIGINSNNWFSDESYRKEIAEKLNLSFSDNGIEIPHKVGRSSFNNKTKDAREFDILGRYKHYINDGKYLSLFDDEIISLTQKCFGFGKLW